MIYSLNGVLFKIEDNFLVINCAGVGYKCLTSFYTQSELKDKLNSEVLVYTYMNVRQDAVDLFGFSSTNELSCFKLLTSVSGIGPKAALAILSQFSADKVSNLVCSGDSKSLTTVSGIGAKTAQRIVLELKDKLKGITKNKNLEINFELPKNNNISQAAKALNVLGYSDSEVMPVLSGMDENLPTEKLIQQTLKIMAKGV